MTGIEVRPATESDAGVLWRIHRASMTAYLEEAFPDWTEDRARMDFRAWMAEGSAQVITLDGEPVGGLDVRRDDATIHLARIALDPSAQGRGIGSAVMAGLLAEAAQRGAVVRLEVFAHNPARRLYTRLGFREVGSDGPSIHMEWRPGEA
jgi:ribosomal protein S18 acetylase RimI-like enzyme